MAKSLSLYGEFQQTGEFVWANLPSIVGISIIWFVTSLPIVTIGPATVGAYTAILSLHNDDRAGKGINYDKVKSIVCQQYLHAIIISFLPFVLLMITGAYSLMYIATNETIAAVLTIIGGCFLLYTILVMIPTFLKLANGASVYYSLKEGYLWTVYNPAESIIVGVVTISLVTISIASLGAFFVVFAGLVISFHIQIISPSLVK